MLGHADGICHCYVDAEADLETAARIVLDSKVQYVAVCNALETLLVHEKVAPEFLPAIAELFAAHKVELRGCPQTRAFIPAVPATEEDWQTEYLDYILAVKVVPGIEEAVAHINKYGSGHTESIVTENKEKAGFFMDYVDAGSVFWNCSTRFSDGSRYGFAPKWDQHRKIHARTGGPEGWSYKYRLLGRGHLVADYANHSRSFKHVRMERTFRFEDFTAHARTVKVAHPLHPAIVFITHRPRELLAKVVLDGSGVSGIYG